MRFLPHENKLDMGEKKRGRFPSYSVCLTLNGNSGARRSTFGTKEGPANGDTERALLLTSIKECWARNYQLGAWNFEYWMRDLIFLV